jgi:hypothetical protein
MYHNYFSTLKISHLGREFALSSVASGPISFEQTLDQPAPVGCRVRFGPSPIVLAAQLQALPTMIGSIEERIMAQHNVSEESKRVATVPGTTHGRSPQEQIAT